MTARSCDDWPRLMEIAPELQFKHYRASEVGLPTTALNLLPEMALADVDVCCDLEHHVFNAEHTDPQIAVALAETEWQELRAWTTRDKTS
ncbi:MAG: hypothetical protein QOE29_1201 [Gaiellaceae bacterium]|nr:hypothetical protein [Gaiellaceae bacterium]